MELIPAEELQRGAPPVGLVDNANFVPDGTARKAFHEFNGVLRLQPTTMTVKTQQGGPFNSAIVLGKHTTIFPGGALAFFTHEGHLIPRSQDVVRPSLDHSSQSYWSMIVQPGRTWSGNDDRGLSRGAFPFALVNELEGETHNGVALFLYTDDDVSPVRFQIVQQTAPWYVRDEFAAWGVTAAAYDHQIVTQQETLQRAYDLEVASRLPLAPWSKLGSKLPNAWFEQVCGGSAFPDDPNTDTVQSSVLVDGVVYRSDCITPAGPYPYLDEMRFGAWSMAKSSMLNLAMLRLAEKFGASFLYEPIAAYMPTSSPEWEAVTVIDMANMASGHGPSGDPTVYTADYSRWYEAESKHAKIEAALDYPSFAPPGDVFNYRDQDAFLLGVALEEILKDKEGGNASIGRMLQTEVYQRIGVFHVPAANTSEAAAMPSMPLMTFGHYPTIDELFKIGQLYQAKGCWDGEQLLHKQLVESILPTTLSPELGRSPWPDGYYMNWWFASVKTTSGQVLVPSMRGYGGNKMTLLPDGVIALKFAKQNWEGPLDAHSFGPSRLPTKE